MTEAEELELLELEEEEAGSAAPPPRAPTPGGSSPGVLDTLLHKGTEGFFKGFSDELVGEMSPAMLAAKGQGATLRAPSGRDVSRDAEVQQAGRDIERQEQHRAADAHPWLSTGAQIAGDLASDAALRALGVPGVGSPAYQVATGALSGAGYSEAETPGGVAKDAAVGGGLAGVGYGLGKYVVGPVVSRIGRALPDFAARRAVKATGAIQTDIKGKTEDRLKEIGRQLLEAPAGADGKPVITAGVGRQKVLQRAEEGADLAGPLIGDTLKRADQVAKEAGSGSFDWQPVLGRLRTEVYDKLSETGRRTANQALEFAMDIAEAAKKAGGYADANTIKSDIQGSINWANEAPKLPQQVAKRIQGILDDEIEKQLEGRLGGQVAAEFKDAKSLYGAMKFAEAGGKRAKNQQMGNRWLSPSDYLVASAGGVGGGAYALSQGQDPVDALQNVATGASLGFGNKLLRERGSSVLAVGAKKLSDSALFKSMIKAAPDALGKFAPALMKALQSEDPSEFAVTDFVLDQQDQEYREHKKRAMEQARQE